MKGNILFRSWKARIGVAALAAVTLAGVGFNSAGAATVKSTNIVGSGSDASYKPTTALDTLYNQSAGCNTIVTSGVQPLDYSCLADTTGTIKTENYAHDLVSEEFPLGASNGIAQLCANLGNVSFARNTRAVKSSDCTGLHFVSFARDGLAWECFGTCHNVTNLTKVQLQGIYGDCSINNWSQVGGTAGPIVVYGVNPGSGVKSNFNSYLGITDDTHCAPADGKHVIKQNENASILANHDQANAIFYFSIASWLTQIKPHPDTSKLGNLESVVPSQANISNGTYPLGFNEGFVYCKASTGASPCPKPATAATLRYVNETTGWICKGSAAAPHLAAHANDATTHVNYRTEIEQTLAFSGLVPITYGPTGGSAAGSSFCRETDG
jgi:ABC-type phosphate transport system substrate-binding protein